MQLADDEGAFSLSLGHKVFLVDRITGVQVQIVLRGNYTVDDFWGELGMEPFRGSEGPFVIRLPRRAPTTPLQVCA